MNPRAEREMSPKRGPDGRFIKQVAPQAEAPDYSAVVKPEKGTNWLKMGVIWVAALSILATVLILLRN